MACFWGLSDVDSAQVVFNSFIHLGKQTAGCRSPHEWLMLAMDLAALCDVSPSRMELKMTLLDAIWLFSVLNKLKLLSNTSWLFITPHPGISICTSYWKLLYWNLGWFNYLSTQQLSVCVHLHMHTQHTCKGETLHNISMMKICKQC